MKTTDRSEESATAIDALLRAAHAEGNITKFSLLVTSHVVAGSASGNTTKTTVNASIVRADGETYAITRMNASATPVARWLGRSGKRADRGELAYLASEIAHARKKKTRPFDATIGMPASAPRLLAIKKTLADHAESVGVMRKNVIIATRAIRETIFFSDEHTPLTRVDEGSLHFQCDLRFPDGPRRKGSPEWFTLRSATLETRSWPDEKALRDLVARAAKAESTF